ncbi:MAG: bifunctional adenosylcobinamide kinase/adenosylcobinamide-phosphate guanylyltransferase [Firmicutes bacterium]|nr:bifunctional adenosylcobinamide kinase/adenosylcobinamide-phosphate guanylyltransferase [Bacillota bacterium]
MPIHLVLGGARSGKTRFAEEGALMQANQLTLPACYVATGVRTDEEMEQRIETHQATRSQLFETVERPRGLAQWLTDGATQEPAVLLIDCLATYLGTLLFDAGETLSQSLLLAQGVKLLEAFAAYPYPLWVVSNEVGMGIVPAYASTRLYRDVLGRLNSELAQVAHDVTFLVAGLPMPLKRRGRVCAPAVEE